MTTLEPFEEGDLYLSVMKGASGPRRRAAAAGRRRSRATSPRATCCRASRTRSTAWCSDGDGAADEAATATRREEFRAERLRRARPAREWWAEQRERVLAQDMIEPVRTGLAESMKLSARWAAEYRGFWDLDPDFELEAPTPTVAIERAPEGKVTPEESADEFLAALARSPRSSRRGRRGRRSSARRWRRCSTRSSRAREVKDIQSGYKDPDRFDKWLAILQERVPYDEPIVLPLGEGLNVVRPLGATVSW